MTGEIREPAWAQQRRLLLDTIRQAGGEGVLPGEVVTVFREQGHFVRRETLHRWARELEVLRVIRAGTGRWYYWRTAGGDGS